MRPPPGVIVHEIAGNLGWITGILRPFGHLSAVDLAGPIDTGLLMPKSVSFHTEMVFSQITYGGDIASQGRILGELAADAAAGRLRPSSRHCSKD